MNDLFGEFEPDHAALSGAYEPNDTFQTAATLDEGAHEVTGSGMDWFQFEVVSGQINIDMTPQSEYAGRIQDMNISLYRDPTGPVLASGGGLPTGATETINYLASDGTYYLKVIWAQYPDGDHPDGATYTYSLDVDLPEEMPSDGNDTLETATPITGSGTTIHSGTGVDWYRVDTLSGEMSFSVTPTAGQNLNFTLHNADGTILRAGQGAAEATKALDYLAGTDDTYYLKVFWARYPDGAPNGVTLDYSLSVDLPVEQPSDGNDTMATATVIGAGTATRSGTGIDWYRFETGPGVMDFSLDSLAFPGGTVPNLNLTLYTASGDVIRGSSDSFSYTALQQGDYFLRVNWEAYPEGAPNGYTMRYDLSLDLPVNTWSMPLDFGPVHNASVTVYDIDNDGKDEIFAGTTKRLDAEGNEILPAGLIALEDTGAVKWTQTFAASPGIDSATGKRYETSSVSTAPVFSDVDGDGSVDIVVGVGADNGRDEFGVMSQPGDMGGVYALNADGSIKWSFVTRDTFGDDNRSDGVYGTPRIFDIDGDGVREVIFTSWDHYLYILDGRTGTLEREFNLYDTSGSTPAIGDIDGDGLFDLVVSSDISVNDDAGLHTQGGMLQVLTGYANPIVPGWTDQISSSTSASFRGKFDEQSLWSSPQLVDLDQNGTLEIVQGTGDFFQDGRGQHVRVWNSDGTLRFELGTDGRVLASPLIADLDGDGRKEIIAATMSGHVQAWSASGTALFNTEITPYGTDASEDPPIVHQPIAVDMNGDGQLEILVSIASQMIALNSNGQQISGVNAADRVYNIYTGSPVARDIDGDGRLDLISGGSTSDREQAMIFRYENPYEVVSDSYRTGAYQGAQSLHDIQDFVGRFYETILGREADPTGLNNWTDRLYTGVRSGADVARGFVFSAEFVSQNTTNTEYVETLYAAFFGRPADAGGLAGWTQQLANGVSRAQVLNGFIYSQEFGNLASSYGILVDSDAGPALNEPVITGDGSDSHLLIGGAGNNVIYDEGTGVQEVHANDKQVAGQVFRLYEATFDRLSDARGFVGWTTALQTNLELVQVASAFVNSAEFQLKYGALDNEGFVSLLYQNVLGRAPDAAGLNNWVTQLENGTSRAQVLLGFSESAEFKVSTTPALDNFMRMAELTWIDVIEGGAGNDTMNANTGGDIFIFRQGEGGNDLIHGFEPWDELQFSGFGYRNGSDAMAHMEQSGPSVVFRDQGQAITFLNTSMAEMRRVLYNVS